MQSKSKIHHKILIIGGGTAGITIAARLARAGLAHDVCIIEPSENHYYQPLWTLVAAGFFDFSSSRRATKDYIPRGVTWFRDAAVSISAASKTVLLESGVEISCDWMVVCTGVECDWDSIKGAREALAAPNVSCIYDKAFVDKTRDGINAVSSGKLLFTFPPPPVKCAGAPQKIMYLADEMLRRRGVRGNVTIEYRSAIGAIFGIPVFAEVLNKVVARKKILTRFNQKLIEIRHRENKALFTDVACEKELEEVSYAFLHVVPSMRPHEVIRESDLSLQDGPGKGWVDVDPFTLRHQRWSQVFALGDVCNAPNAKTGAAIRRQAPVVVSHLLADMDGVQSSLKYDGYASCPLITGFGKVVLAEFGYDGALMPSFPMNPAKESRLMWWLKTIGLPKMYWYFMLRGRA